jgi:sporulation protein YlmC with PRC-barrel domain
MLSWIRGNRNAAAADIPIDAGLVGVKSLVANRVYDGDGVFVGRLEEIVIDTRSGCARHAVLSVGGILGIGRKRLAVPWSALKPDPQFCRCVIDLTQMHLVGVPVPDDDPWLQRRTSTSANEGHSGRTRAVGVKSNPRTFVHPMQGA